MDGRRLERNRILQEGQTLFLELAAMADEIMAQDNEAAVCRRHNMKANDFRRTIRTVIRRHEPEKDPVLFPDKNRAFYVLPEEELLLDIQEKKPCNVGDLPPDTKETAEYLMDQLRPKERDLLKCCYWNGQTLQQVADLMHVTKSRAGQIREAALNRLRNPKYSIAVAYGIGYQHRMEQAQAETAKKVTAKTAAWQERMERLITDGTASCSLDRLRQLRDSLDKEIQDLEKNAMRHGPLPDGISKDLRRVLTRHGIRSMSELSRLRRPDMVWEAKTCHMDWMPELDSLMASAAIPYACGEIQQMADAASPSTDGPRENPPLASLSQRAANILLQNGISSLEQLEGWTFEHIHSLAGAGQKTAMEIMNAAHKKGVNVFFGLPRPVR